MGLFRGGLRRKRSTVCTKNCFLSNLEAVLSQLFLEGGLLEPEFTEKIRRMKGRFRQDNRVDRSPREKVGLGQFVPALVKIPAHDLPVESAYGVVEQR